MKSWKKYAALTLVFTLLAYPLFYYVLKYGTPEFGGKDVFSYVKLYDNWDYKNVDSPFNQRIVSSYAIFLIHKTGIHYTTEMAVTKSGIDPHVYFSAVLFNFLCVVATCLVLYRMVEKYLRAGPLFAFLAGLVFLFGFGTQAFLISALSDSLSVLLIAAILYSYLARSWWLLLFLLISVFQREYIFFVFGLIALIDWFANRKQIDANRAYFLKVLAANVFCFLIYYICRKTIFFTPRFEHQIDISRFISNIPESIQDIGAYIRQTFLTQNLVFLYLFVYAYKRMSGREVNNQFLLTVFLLLAQIVVLSLLVRLGNNTGRYFYMAIPVVIYYLMAEALPLVRELESKHAQKNQG